MKNRLGFVSNSSSSSFIVGFDEIPTSPVELEQMMFGTPQIIEHYDESMDSIDVAKKVLLDIITGKAKQITTKQEVLEAILSGYFPGYPEHDYRSEKESYKIRKEYSQKVGKDIFDDDKKLTEKEKAIQKSYKKAYKKAYQKETLIWEKSRNAAEKSLLKEFWPKIKGKYIYVFSYSDNSGESLLEHGEIFSNFEHLRINHH
jgi:hypothetical protein